MDQEKQVSWTGGLAVGIIIGAVIGIVVYASISRANRARDIDGAGTSDGGIGAEGSGEQVFDREQLVLLSNEQQTDTATRSLRQAIVIDQQLLTFRMPYYSYGDPKQQYQFLDPETISVPLNNPFQIFFQPTLRYLDAELVKAGKYFSVQWPADYRIHIPSCDPQGCHNGVLAAIIEEGKAAVAVDIVFDNSGTQPVNIEAINQFRLKSGDVYFAPQVSYAGSGSGSIFVSPPFLLAAHGRIFCTEGTRGV